MGWSVYVVGECWIKKSPSIAEKRIHTFLKAN
jgi:hypothetical protein